MKPEWLDKKISLAKCAPMDALLDGIGVRTVCRSACCPNIEECFTSGHVTFLLLGNVCTRGCRFCNVERGVPEPPDRSEPSRVAEAAARLGLSHVIITGVTRDDLPDGGAAHFARTVLAVRRRLPTAGVEILIPDFQGDEEAIEVAAATRPDIIAHNIETVPRLYPEVRRGASYDRSLGLLMTLKRFDRRLHTKSGLMLGMGESRTEVLQALADLRDAECDSVSLGQYLAPSALHHPVREYLPPARFEEYREDALRMGFLHVASGPYVRSSYRCCT
jgi:lipoic acid synthetase